MKNECDYERFVFMVKTVANKNVPRTIMTTLNLVMQRRADDMLGMSLVRYEYALINRRFLQ